jgi:hypothetical protein
MGDHQRLPGKMQFHYRFAFDDRGIPMMYVFNNCKHFIRTIPTLIYDSTNVEDIDSTGEDHIYDCVRYVLMENPITPRKNVLSPIYAHNPLEDVPKILPSYNFYSI